MPLIKRKIRAKSNDSSPLVSPDSPTIEIETAPDELVPEENYETVGIIEGLEEGVDLRALPKPRGKTLNFVELMDYLGSLTSEHWKHTIAYVYRLYPICDAKINNPDAPTSIGKISQPMTTKQFVDTYGGGKYKIIVNDVDIIKNKHRDLRGNHRTVCYSVFSIKWTDFDPILNPSELIIDDPRNKPFLTYWIAKGKLNGDYSMVTSQPTGVSSEIIGFMRDLLDRMDRSNKQVLDTIQRNANSGNTDANRLLDLYQSESGKREELMIKMMEGKGGPEQLQMILSLLKEIKPAETGMNGQLDMFKQMLTMQEENRKAQMDLMMKLMERNNPEEKKEPKSLLEQLEEAKSVMDMLGGGGKKSTAEVIVDTVKELATNIGPYIMQYVMAKQGVNAIPMPASNAPVANQTPVAQIEQPDMKTLAKQFIAQYGQLLIMQIDQQKSGGELADLVIEMFGMDGYVNIKAFGKQNIIDAAKGSPAFWQRVVISAGTEEEVIKFIDEFFDPPKEEEEEGVIQ